MLQTIKPSEVPTFRRALMGVFTASEHEIHHRNLSTPGGYISNAKLYWVPSHGLWANFDDDADEARNRWLFWFGTSLGERHETMGPHIEINIGLDPANKQIAGRALKDSETGQFYLGHKGGLGGGRGGQMSLARFAQHIVGFVREPILLGEDRDEGVFIIGGVSDDDLVARLKSYVDECARLRILAHQRSDTDRAEEAGETPAATFNPENAADGTGGGRAATSWEIARLHGRVVNALQAQLGDVAVNSVHKAIWPDLYILEKDGTLRMLFEVKSASTTQSWFSAIGQLVVYGAGQDKPPTRVLVAPAWLRTPNFRRALEALNILFVRFEEGPDGEIVFFGLDQVL